MRYALVSEPDQLLRNVVKMLVKSRRRVFDNSSCVFDYPAVS